MSALLVEDLKPTIISSPYHEYMRRKTHEILLGLDKYISENLTINETFCDGVYSCSSATIMVNNGVQDLAGLLISATIDPQPLILGK